MKYILAYDLGTGGTKACLYTTAGFLVASEFTSVKTHFPKEKFHEQCPEDWWMSVLTSTQLLLKTSGICPDNVLGIAGSGHSLGAVPIDNNGRLLQKHCPIWSDARADVQATRFFEAVDEAKWYQKTGNGFPACQYAAFKIMWLKDHEPALFEQTACFLGTKDYVNYRLTGVAVTDHSYASGSGVYDLQARAYDTALISATGISPAKLPKILESSDVLGTLTQEAAQLLGLPCSVQVVAGGVDNACMATGAGCISDGLGYTSLGTSAWIAVSSHQPLVNQTKRSYVFAHCVPGMFTSATCIFSAGNSLRWIKNNLCQDLIARSEESSKDVYDLMTEIALQSPVGAHKLLFNPSLAGGSATEKSPDIRGGFVGLTLGHTRADVLRAVLEGIAMNLRLSMDILADITPLSPSMLLVGGGGKSAMWRQIFADIYEKNILETSVGQDAGSLGAMACAAVGLGLWDSYDQVQTVHEMRNTKIPNPVVKPVYDFLRPVFIQACDAMAALGEQLAYLPM